MEESRIRRKNEERKRVKPLMLTDFEFANEIVLLSEVMDQAQKLLHEYKHDLHEYKHSMFHSTY